MNRILISIGAFIQNRAQALRRRPFSALVMLALAAACNIPAAYGQQTNLTEYEVVSRVPEGGFRLFEKSYVLLNNEFEFVPMMFYEYDRETPPDLFEHFFHNNPDETQFTLEADYYNPIDNLHHQHTLYPVPGSGQTVAFVTSEPVKEPMNSVARYRNFKRTYKQLNPDPNPAPGESSVETAFRQNRSRVFHPAIRKIPFYLQLELLDSRYEDMFELKSPLGRFIEPTQRNGMIGQQVSRIATGMFEPPFESDDRHIACPVWYEFKFMGYVDGFPDGLDGEDGATIYNLPDGVTFVSGIDDCNGPPEPGQQIRGCALPGGTKIAVLMELLKDKFVVEADKRKHFLGPVLLHELAHAYGISGHSHDSDNLMADSTVEAPYVDREQCEVLTKRVQNRPHIGFSGHEPWGK